MGNGFLLQEGRLQAGAALGLAAITAGVVTASSWPDSQLAGRTAILGVTILLVALVLGSARLVGISTLPILGGAIMASRATELSWARMIVVGCLWYIAAELAWDAIERRDGAGRSKALENRRVHEIATVVALALAITTAGYLTAFLAPARTLVAEGLGVLGVVAVIGLAIRRLNESRREDEDDALQITSMHRDAGIR